MQAACGSALRLPVTWLLVCPFRVHSSPLTGTWGHPPGRQGPFTGEGVLGAQHGLWATRGCEKAEATPAEVP